MSENGWQKTNKVKKRSKDISYQSSLPCAGDANIAHITEQYTGFWYTFWNLLFAGRICRCFNKYIFFLFFFY